MRATAAAASDVQLYVRLVEVDANGGVSVVNNGLMSFGSVQPTSNETMPLTLDDPQATYRVQVQVLPVSQRSSAPPSPGTASLYSVELVMKQTDTSGYGIGKTVGWYPGVTAGTTASSNAFLDHQFRAPVNTVEESFAAWHVGVKSLTPGGSVGADLWQRQPDVSLEESGTTTSTSFIDLDVQIDTAGTVPVRDTRSVVSSGGSGRIARTLMRVAWRLRDVDPPVVRELVPGDRANTSFGGHQPILVRIEDSSALDLPSLTLVVDGVVRGAQLDASSGWVRTDPLVLAAGDHAASFRISDQFGNEVLRAWSFRVIRDPVVTNATVAAFALGENTGVTGSSPNTDIWQFIPELTVGDRQVKFADGSAHPGWGVIGTTVNFDDATVELVRNGQVEQWPVNPIAGISKTIWQQAVYTKQPSEPQTFGVPAETANLPAVSIDLPSDTESAALRMEPLTTYPGAFGGLCGDPTAAGALGGCSPDPLRIHLLDNLAEFIEDEIQAQQAPKEEDEELVYIDHRTAAKIMTYQPDDLSLYLLGGRTDRSLLRWVGYQPLGGVLCSASPTGAGPTVDPFDPNIDPVFCFVDGLDYPDSRIISPVQFAEVCANTPLCAYESPQANLTRRQRCVSQNYGWDQYEVSPDYDENAQGCAQQMAFSQVVGEWTGVLPGANRRYNIGVGWGSDWGYEDGFWDELGVHWEEKHQSYRDWNLMTGSTVGPFTSYLGEVFAPTANDRALFFTSCKPEGFNASSSWGNWNGYWYNPQQGRYGLGSGDPGPEPDGFRQFQVRDARACQTQSGDGFYWYRTYRARVDFRIQLVGAHENPRKGLNFTLSWGHMVKDRTWRDLEWFLVYGAACATASGGSHPRPQHSGACSGIGYTGRDSLDDQYEKTHTDSTTFQWLNALYY